MTQHLKIDFVSDIACPWCIIGLRGLQVALDRVSGSIEADVVFHPFELNPHMPAGGQNVVEHVAEKYGSSAADSEASRAMIQSRAEAVGFSFNFSEDSRIYNTFDAHRLLYWAKSAGRQQDLKVALFKANFSDSVDVSDREVLAAVAISVGLDGNEAREILAGGRYAEEVRAEEQLWQSRGISSVPAIIINEKWLISGGQPAEAFENALRNIAAELSTAGSGS